MSKFEQYNQLPSVAPNDLALVTDITDQTMSPNGTTKQILVQNLLAGVAGLVAPTGLRRWRAMLGDALFTQVPIVVVGDSITAGIGGDNNTSTFNNIPDNSQGWVGQLRALFAAALGTYPGEGFIFSDDSRVTNNGGSANVYACTPLTHGYRLVGAAQTLTFTVPDGVTSLGIIQANQTASFNSGGSGLADVSATYSQTGSATVSGATIATLTATGRSIETFISVRPGDVITVAGPVTAQSYIVGFDLRTGNPGVLVHRVAVSGYTSGDILGSQSNGVLTNNGNSTLITDSMRACYDWAGTQGAAPQGLVICCMLGNDQQCQAGGGSCTAKQSGITNALYTSWMTQFFAQAISDGWAVMMYGPPRNPNQYVGGAGTSEDAYLASILSWVQANDHASYLDTGALWGSYAASTALGLVDGTHVHPFRRGHGDMARMVYRAIAGVSSGITEITPA